MMTLRIIGGDLRRRLLKTPPGMATRPYTDRVRQIVFDRIHDVVPASRVADIFAGVGTMGLESLSRGADSCVFMESDRRVHQTLRQNVDLLAPDATTVCWKTDVRFSSFSPAGRIEVTPYSLVFFDPPYIQCSTLEPRGVLAKALQRLAKPSVTSADVLLILRTPEAFELPELSGWQQSDCWHLSSMRIWSLRKVEKAALSDPEEAGSILPAPTEFPV